VVANFPILRHSTKIRQCDLHRYGLSRTPSCEKYAVVELRASLRSRYGSCFRLLLLCEPLHEVQLANVPHFSILNPVDIIHTMFSHTWTGALLVAASLGYGVSATCSGDSWDVIVVGTFYVLPEKCND
jgi:hypothetical protein